MKQNHNKEKISECVVSSKCISYFKICFSSMYIKIVLLLYDMLIKFLK